MAVVGEARIIVRAITTGVGNEIERGLRDGERRAEKSGERMGRSLNDGIKRATSGRNSAFNNMFDFDAANKTREAWVRLQKAGFNLQTGAGVLAGSLGSLVGALGGLVGSVGNATGALTALAGTFVAVKIGSSLAGMALGGISAAFGKATSAGGGLKKTAKELKEELDDLRWAAEEAALGVDRAGLNLEKAREGLARVADLAPNNRLRREAELAVKEAELALRKAKDASEDAKDDYKKGPKASAGAASDPYAGLTKSQKAFAKTLVELKPKFDELKEAVAQGFLPELDTQIRNLMKGRPFQVLKDGFTGIGDALGETAFHFGTFLTSTRGLDNMQAIFATSDYAIRGLGRAFTSVFGSFTDILKAADPITKDFVNFIEAKAGAFDAFLQTDKGKKQLESFLGEGKRVAVDFGAIFGNIFKGVGKIMEANFGPGSGGDILIKGLKTATEGFANLDKMAGGKDALRQYFIGAAENTKSMFGSVGALVKELIKLGDEPQIKVFWDTLKEGAPMLGQILKSGIEAAPALARLIVSLTRIVTVLADSGAIIVFYDTLNTVATALATLLENETVRAFLNVIAKVAAFALALGSIAAIAGKVGAVLFATFARFGPIFGPVLFIISAIVGAFILLYQTNAEAKKQIDELGAAFMTAFGDIAKMAGGLMAEIGPVLMDALKVITDALMALLPVIKDQLMPAFFNLIKTILPLIPVIVEYLVPAFASIVASVLPLIATLLTSLMPVIGILLKNLVPLIAMIVDNLVPVFTQIMDAVTKLLPPIMSLIGSLIEALMPAILIVVNAVLPLVAAIAEALIPVIELLVDILAPVLEIFTFIVGIVAELVAGFASFLIPIIVVVLKIFTGLAKFFMSVLGPAINNIGTIFRIIFTGINGFFKGIMNNLISFAEGFINFFIDGMNGIIKALNTFKIKVPEALRVFTNGAKEIGFNISPLAKVKLARLADGGTVMPSPGGTLAQIAEAGRPERVEPLDPDGLSQRDKAMIEKLTGGGSGRPISITVNPSAGMDEKALALEVSRQLAFEIRRGGV